MREKSNARHPKVRYPIRRRALLAIGIGALLNACAGTGSGGEPLGTAVIGLRIEDNPALRQVRAGYRTLLPILTALHADASASLKFGRVEPETGGIDLPFLAGLYNESVLLNTSGYQTSFKAARLVPGRYVTMQATFLENPSSNYRLVRVLAFSGRSHSSASASQLGGYEFTVEPGRTVYVGTMVLALAHLGEGRFKYAPPRIEDEFVAAAAANPDLRQLERTRATRLMTLFGRGAGPAEPEFPPPMLPSPAAPQPAVPQPAVPQPAVPPPQLPAPSNASPPNTSPPAGPPRVPRIG